MSRSNPFWTAQRPGIAWRDDDVLAAIGWLTSTIESQKWLERIEATRSEFEARKRRWAQHPGELLYDPSDAIAWYIFQANAYAVERHHWFEPDAYRITPLLKRLGQLLPHLDAVDGCMDRVHSLMTHGKSRPDDGLYELLVAGAYKRHWPEVSFVPERPGLEKTQDILVKAPRRRWAVECKRVNRSAYEKEERRSAELLSRRVHDFCREKGRSVVLTVSFQVELALVSDSYLAEKAASCIGAGKPVGWTEDVSIGVVKEVDWRLAQAVLRTDDVFFGSSRMIELLLGHYDNSADYSIEGDWTPSVTHPLHATQMSRASLVGWKSRSREAARRKAKHFRAMVAKANAQLPGDCPGVIHVGYEATIGNSEDRLRHLFNTREIRSFDPGASRLRWVYGNYMWPEHTNHPNESLAISETMAPYKVGRHRVAGPLPGHLLFLDDQGRPGSHWVH